MPEATSSPVLITPSKKMRSEISFPVSPKIPASTQTKYIKQIRLLKQKLRRREATIKNMKGLLDSLKNIGIKKTCFLNTLATMRVLRFSHRSCFSVP